MERDRADVVIIGAGLAGLAVAAHLRDADVLVLEAEAEIGRGAAGGEDGLVRPGLLEHPGSLVAALGAVHSAEIYRMGADGLGRLEAAGLLRRTGLLALATGPGEDAALLEQDAARLCAMGLPARFLPEEEVAELLGIGGLGAARLESVAGLVEPDALLRWLAEAALQAGARIRLGAPVRGLREERDGHLLLGPGLEVRTSIVVYAAGVGLRALDPFFAQTLLPARQSHLLVPGALRMPVVGGHGLTRARPCAEGVLLSGARWATPNLEIGEDDADTVPAPVQAALRRFGAQLGMDPSTIMRRRAGIQAMTCDGLPLVGPLPGRVTEIACAGWNGQDLALALQAGVGVAEGIVTGRSIGVPRVFSPSRMA